MDVKGENSPFLDNLEYLDLLFLVETVRAQRYFNTLQAVDPFLPSTREIGTVLSRQSKSASTEDSLATMKWDSYVKAREEATMMTSIPPNIVALFRKLNPFEKGVLVLSILCYMDEGLRKTIRFFHGDVEKSFPTIELYGKIYFQDVGLSLTKKSDIYMGAMETLSYFFYPLKKTEFPTVMQLIPDKRLISILVENYEVSLDVFGYYYQLEKDDRLLFREEETQRISKFLNENLEGGIYLYGEVGCGKKAIIAHSLKEQSIHFFVTKMEEQTEEEKHLSEENSKKIFMAIRESLLLGDIPVIEGMETLDYQIQREIIDQLYDSKTIFFCLADQEERPSSIEKMMMMEIPKLNEFQRCEIWKTYGKKYKFESNVDFTYVANTFSFTPGKIKSALALASMERGGEQHSIGRDGIYRACYSLVDHKLSEKAKRVTSTFQWDDLKLPFKDKELLRDLCNRVKNKHIVMSEWGFSEKLPYGSGISAVFAGPPGTGKTMAANVIANELHMEMYQIDLSQIVDKYIGETEKNIKLIFDQAKKSNSILFFDEADSLFAKRVESKSSNDRFANIESSMLLQCVEQYPGISILATNNYTSIDPAFIRRLKYRINFNLPDEATRLEIWKSVFPKGVPIAEDVSLHFYAKQFEFSGAYIKNIALAATFLAAEEGCEVENVHLFTAIGRELMKEGRRLEQGQLAQYGYLYHQVV